MIYIDKAGHLVTDSNLEELHEFAEKIGLKQEWFQNTQNKNHPHYDLTTQNMIEKAIENGANLVSSKEIVCILQDRKGD